MKKTFLATVLILLSTFIFGQAEKANYKSAADIFEKNYNAGDFDAIFSLFAPQLKNALPVDKTKSFLSGLKIQAGKITKRTFVNYQNGTYFYFTKL